jgi:hypothetical protein
MRCWGVQWVANPAFLSGFLCSALLCVAPYCVPGSVRVVSGGRGLRIAGFLASQMWQALEGRPNRRGEVPTRYFHLRLRFPVPLTRANIRAELTLVVLTIMLGTDVALFPGSIGSGLCTILHLDLGEPHFHALG